MPARRIQPESTLWLEQLRAELAALSGTLDTSYIVQDCSLLPRILAKYIANLGPMLMLGHWGNRDGQIFFIRSASFWIEDGKLETLDSALPTTKDERGEIHTYGDIDKLARRFEQLGVEPGKYFRSNCTCFIGKNRRTPKQLSGLMQDIVILYQRMLLSSLNFVNFIDGRNYRLAKPISQEELHPKFTSFLEVTAALRATFSIGSEYFVFTGLRKSLGPRTVKLGDFRQQDNTTIDSRLPFGKQRVFKAKLQVSIALKQPIMGMAISSSDALTYCIFSASDPSIRGSPVEGVLVIWANGALPMEVFRAASVWLRETAARRHIEKARFLTELRALSEDELQKATDGAGLVTRQESVRRVGAFLCQRLTKLTNATSATLRLREGSGGKLRQYARAHSPLGEYASEIEAIRPELDISVKEWSSSANAFAFHFPRSDPWIDIPNVEAIPRKYVRAGLNQVLRARTATRSEAVLRVRRGGLLGAVINVESPAERALRHELPFLGECAKILSDFLTRMDTLGDRIGLAMVAETQLEVHDIKHALMTWDGVDPTRALAIVNRLKTHLSEQTQSVESLTFAGRRVALRPSAGAVQRFNRILRERIGGYLTDTGATLGVAGVLTGQIPEEFPTSDIPSLVVIFDSIWGNIVTHSKLAANRLEILSMDQPFAKQRVMTIRWDAPGRLRPELDRDRAFLQPLHDSKGLHFGLFLIGVHVRLLGGQVTLSEAKPPASGFSVDIRVPYDPPGRFKRPPG